MTRAPLVMGKAQEAFQRSAEDLRHHARLALRQSAAQGAIRRRLHGRDRRERRRGIPGLARRPGCLCGALAAARGQGDGGGLFRRGDRRGRSSRRQERAGQGREGRASAPGDDARRLEQAQADRAQSRHHHRRQRLGHQRRRGGRDPRLGAGGAASRAHAARARARHGVGGGAAAGDGHRPGAFDPQADGAARVSRSAIST